jgi:3-deoxy-D-manno-octulosonate 8-phosphate phosphatase (KDO 8-P phosphatase)
MNTSTVSADAIARASRVKLMVFDVDGILTDGSLHFGPEGEIIKTFNVLDGHGIKMLQQSGVVTAIISARQSAIVLKRATDLGIQHVQQGIHEKGLAFEQLISKTGIPAELCGFIGDDVIDLPILMRVGFAASVPNGHHEVQSRVHHITKASGGRGAVREICDLILRAQNNYEAAMAPYLP